MARGTVGLPTGSCAAYGRPSSVVATGPHEARQQQEQEEEQEVAGLLLGERHVRALLATAMELLHLASNR